MCYSRFLGFLTILLCFASCTLLCKNTSCRQSSKDLNPARDSTKVVYNDSIDSIILYSDKIRLYDMADFGSARDSTVKCDSILGYAIKSDMGLLKSHKRDILKFIISDNQFFIENYPPVKHIFYPNIVLEFCLGRQKAFMLVSFSSEEVAISDVNGVSKRFMMSDTRLLARWANLAFPEDDYYKLLIKLL